MNVNTPFRLSAVRTYSEPFRYLASPEALTPEISRTVLTWLEAHAPWKLVETDLYEQFEFSLCDIQVPAHLVFLQDSSFVAAIQKQVAALFDVHLSDRLDITAHKLVSGQQIRLHNDWIPGAETHRLLIQFNRGWHDENGGFLLLFNSADPDDIHKIFRPVHNSAVGFAISATSYHAVSKLHAGERFTLVYSFYEI